MSLRKTFFLPLLLVAAVLAQNQSPGNGPPIMSCLTGQEYFQSDAVDGENKWWCNSKQVWVHLVPAGGGIPSGAIVILNAGSCPNGYDEVSTLNGKTLVGTLSISGDVGNTGGNDSLTPTGSVSQPTFTGTDSQATSAVSGGTPAGTVSQPTFTGSALSAHAHGVGTLDNAAITAGTPAGTNSTVSFTPAGTNSGGAVSAHAGTAVADHASHTHTGASTGSPPKLVTANTSSGVSEVTGGPSITLTHSVTQPSAHTFTQPTFAGTQGTVPAQTFTGSQLPTHDHTLSGSSESLSAGTPAGVVSQPTFSGNALPTHQHTLTPSGVVSQPTFAGNAADNRSAYVKVIFCKKA